MNDYDEQLLGEGTPELSPQEIAELEQQQSLLQDSLLPEQPVVEQSQVPQTQATAQPQAPAQQTEGPERIGFLPKEVHDFTTAPGAGIADFVVDALNLIPKVDIPKAPEFENDVSQTVREISSIVIPTALLGGMGSGAIAGRAAGVTGKMGKFLNDPLVKQLGNVAFQAGAGAAVDYTVEINQEDDNLAGSLRKTWPRWFGWVPDDLATLDSDSPDVKRAKNVTEGTYLGIGTDVLLGLNKLFRSIGGFQKGAPIPKTEKAGQYFKKNVEVEGNVEDVVEASAAKRAESFDELGTYNFATSTDLDQPIFGYHDLYDYQEVGIRSVDDMGIVGASIDAGRIANNIDTVYGRIGNSISEGALKFSLNTVENQQSIQKGLADVLTEADQYGYRSVSGKELSYEQIQDAGERLAATYYKMDVDQMRAALTDYQTINTTTSVPVLTDEALAGVKGALNKYMDDYVNMNYMRAQAYIGTSFAGQISDMAQGMRLTEGSLSIQRAQQQILDRMEFLMVQRDMTEYSSNRFKGMFEMFNTLSRGDSSVMSAKEAKRIEDAIRGESDKTAAALSKIKEEARATIDNLREIGSEQPEMLKPLMLAYELTDGNIDTITKLNRYLKESTSVLKKAFIDGTPEIPSYVLKGFYSNLYNGTLSAFGTPIKAGFSAAAQLIERPVRTMAGGLMNKDMATVRRAWHQYSAAGDALQGSFAYMKQVFKRSGMDPNVVKMREDYGVSSKQLALINSFADAKAAQGDYGPQVFAEIANNMDDLANHPWLRFGNRSMQAFDGFTQSMVAMAEARGRAYDQVTKGGQLELDEAKFADLSKKVYDKMFDKTGLITDEAVQKASGELSLTLDNVATDSLSNLIRYAPILKPFLLFTKTPINELALSASYSPLGVFMKDLNAFRLPFEEMPYQEVESLLAARGIEITPDTVRSKYNELRADYKGRKGLGSLMVLGTSFMFLNGNITGNGLYDKQKQSLRRNADWKPRSIRMPNGSWVSYDNLGPITNWLSLTADILDNFDSLAPKDLQEQIRKMGFIMAAAITDKTALAGIEPLFDILSGDVGNLTRWSSSFLTSALVPGSSQLAEISRLMDPGLKEVEQDVYSLMRNRNPFTKNTLPAKYDWVDGGEVGVPDNIWARIWNTYMPWKVNGKISPEKQFLVDIEYDARPTLMTDGNGLKITAAQRSEILETMGRDGLFKEAIKKVMKRVDAKKFRREYKKAVDQGLTPDLTSFMGVHAQLDKELRNVIDMAKVRSTGYSDMTRKNYIQNEVGRRLREGDLSGADEFLNYMEKFSK